MSFAFGFKSGRLRVATVALRLHPPLWAGGAAPFPFALTAWQGTIFHIVFHLFPVVPSAVYPQPPVPISQQRLPSDLPPGEEAVHTNTPGLSESAGPFLTWQNMLHFTLKTF